MKRREFITLVGGVAAWPISALAQQRAAKIHRIFWASTEAQPDPFVEGFREGLRELGYAEGNNLALQLRYAPGNPDALRSALSELTRDKVDLAVSSGPAIRAMKAATDIPRPLCDQRRSSRTWSCKELGPAGWQLHGQHVSFAGIGWKES